MARISRHMIALAAALAVFVVGTTCTRAGCVIPVEPVRAAGQRSCCAGESDRHRTDGRSTPTSPTKSCPACDQPLFAGDGGTTVKTIGHGKAPLVGPAIDFAPLFTATVPYTGPVARLPLYDGPPPNDLGTRLALSCALLN